MNSRLGVTATTDMVVLPGVLRCRPLLRTVQVRLGTNPAVPRDELPGGTPIFVVSRQQFMKYPGWIYRSCANYLLVDFLQVLLMQRHRDDGTLCTIV